MNRRKMKPALKTGLCLMGMIILLALLAPVLSKYDPYAQDLPSAQS